MAALVGAALFISTVAAQNTCSTTPIFVDFHNRAVDGGVSQQYGLFTGIGSPTSQNLSLWPSFSNNETTVGSLDYCTTSAFKDCIRQSHGFYEPQLSQAHSSNSSYRPLDDYRSMSASISEIAFDNFNLYMHYFDPSPSNLTTIPDFPVTVLTNYTADSTPWFGPAGLLGLGPRSTLLSRLYDNGLIASRSFGLYMGTAYEAANGSINGSLTLGGYDSGRFDGEVHSFPISQTEASSGGRSPFVITVSQMTLTTKGGESTDLLNQSFDAHLTTSQYPLQLPGAATRQFQDVTRATSSNDGLNVLSLPDNFDSTLTITLASGLTITYDADWLRNVSNSSPISAVDERGDASNSTSSSVPNIFGSAFLSNVYFIANYDASPPVFHLANALPHGPYVMTQALCADTIPAPAAKVKISSFAASGLAGAIVGGVIGGIGLTFFVWWIVRKCLQRRRWRQRAREAMKGKKSVDSPRSGAGGGKGSPANTLDSDEERLNGGGGSEMTTFAFDFNSDQHQAYRTYLQQQSQAAAEPGPKGFGLSTSTSTSTVGGVSDSESEQRIQTQYARSLDDAYSTVSPITPATGVPLLLFPEPQPHQSQQQTQGDTTTTMTTTLLNANSGANDFWTPSIPIPFPHGLNDNNTSDSNSNSAWNNSTESSSFSARSRIPLNVQTEFAPPPTKTTPPRGKGNDKIVRKAVAGGGGGGKKESLLKKVFPPPSASGSK